MVTDCLQGSALRDEWNPDWANASPMFEPLREAAAGLASVEWPNVSVLNALAESQTQGIVNADGKPIRFVTQAGKPQGFEDSFEPRAYLRGEVLVRERNWHDLFNALVWMTFPQVKAAINARHYLSLGAQRDKRRSPEGDALTLFDEDGMVVLSAEQELLELLRNHEWRELFVVRRDSVRANMRFLVFGHAMFEKALHPFIGMTAKCVLLPIPEGVLFSSRGELNTEVDCRLSEFVQNRANLTRGKSLSPLPVLGVPGWWPANEAPGFYGNVSYFRSRSGDASSGASSIT